MANATDSRWALAVRLPQAVWDKLGEEAERDSKSLAELIRFVCRWHRREEPDQRKDREWNLPDTEEAREPVTRQIRVDEDDIDYLDEVAERISVSRSTACLLVILEYLRVAPTVRPPSRTVTVRY